MLFLLLFATDKTASPALPFYDWNACPGEGCVYRQWIAEKPAVVYNTPRPGRRAIGHIRRGEQVVAITGVVVTHEAGRGKLVDLEHPLNGAKPAVIVPTYTYAGEGYAKAWFNDRFAEAEEIEKAKQDWWAEVRLSSGKLGWINMQDADFDGTCALVGPVTLRPRAKKN